MQKIKKKRDVTNIHYKYTDESFKQLDENLQNVKDKLNREIDTNEFIGTAIVTFNTLEDRNLFFRKYHNISFLTCKKPYTFRGKKLYLEIIPSIN